MRYGVPYQGSKNRLARDIVDSLPPCDTFVDLFAGGCAVAHAAILSGKFRRVIINDIDGRGVRLFRAAMAGAYHNETSWVTREQFRVNIRKPAREQDPFAALAWSFNANLREYMYARELEPLQFAKHAAIAWEDPGPLREIGLKPPPLRERTLRGRYYELGAWISDNAAAVNDTYIEYHNRMTDARKIVTAAALNREIGDVDAEIQKEKDRLRAYLLDALHAAGLSQAEVQARLGTFMARHYFGRSQWEFPTFETYERLRTFLPLPLEWEDATRVLYALKDLEKMKSKKRMKNLHRLENIQRLLGLQDLEAIAAGTEIIESAADYAAVDIPPGAVVYCDIPYKGTEAVYVEGFDHASFYEWAAAQTCPLYISEYTMPADRFKIVKSWEIQQLSTAKGASGRVSERLYTVAGRCAPLMGQTCLF